LKEIRGQRAKGKNPIERGGGRSINAIGNAVPFDIVDNALLLVMRTRGVAVISFEPGAIVCITGALGIPVGLSSHTVAVA
jgi:hypothetical protein